MTWRQRRGSCKVDPVREKATRFTILYLEIEPMIGQFAHFLLDQGRAGFLTRWKRREKATSISGIHAQRTHLLDDFGDLEGPAREAHLRDEIDEMESGCLDPVGARRK